MALPGLLMRLLILMALKIQDIPAAEINILRGDTVWLPAGKLNLSMESHIDLQWYFYPPDRFRERRFPIVSLKKTQSDQHPSIKTAPSYSGRATVSEINGSLTVTSMTQTDSGSYRCVYLAPKSFAVEWYIRVSEHPETEISTQTGHGASDAVLGMGTEPTVTTMIPETDDEEMDDEEPISPDTVPPVAPESLSADEVTSTTMRITWERARYNTDHMNYTYNIYYKRKGESRFERYTKSPCIQKGNTFSINLIGLNPQTIYNINIRNDGEQNSNLASLTLSTKALPKIMLTGMTFDNDYVTITWDYTNPQSCGDVQLRILLTNDGQIVLHRIVDAKSAYLVEALRANEGAEYDLQVEVLEGKSTVPSQVLRLREYDEQKNIGIMPIVLSVACAVAVSGITVMVIVMVFKKVRNARRKKYRRYQDDLLNTFLASREVHQSALDSQIAGPLFVSHDGNRVPRLEIRTGMSDTGRNCVNGSRTNSEENVALSEMHNQDGVNPEFPYSDTVADNNGTQEARFPNNNDGTRSDTDSPISSRSTMWECRDEIPYYNMIAGWGHYKNIEINHYDEIRVSLMDPYD